MVGSLAARRAPRHLTRGLDLGPGNRLRGVAIARIAEQRILKRNPCAYRISEHGIGAMGALFFRDVGAILAFWIPEALPTASLTNFPRKFFPNYRFPIFSVLFSSYSEPAPRPPRFFPAKQKGAGIKTCLRGS